jgi:uncharacterized protein YbbC (DUF1343 family)
MVQTGLEVLLEDAEKYKNRNIALIVNQTSVIRDFRYSWDVLREKGLRIRRIFSPEHGLFAVEQDQIKVAHQKEIGCEVVSLYGDNPESLIPDESCLKDIDLVLFDIQDVGSRYYTYVNTMALFMKAIRKTDIELLILDRPNPLGGEIVEGPILEKPFESFVGVFPVPVRHAMTAGELALFYRNRESVDTNVSVVRMKGWKRGMLYDEIGLAWVPPSPNMPTVRTANVYPGMCLFEGLNVSEGRGTTTPFEVFGAPFIDPDELMRRITEMNPEGVAFRPVYFKPTFQKYSDQVVGGLFLHVTDYSRFKPFLTGVALLRAISELYPEKLVFEKGVYEFNDIHPAFDLLAGNSRIRKMIQEHRPMNEIADTWQKDEQTFAEVKQEYHLYGH